MTTGSWPARWAGTRQTPYADIAAVHGTRFGGIDIRRHDGSWERMPTAVLNRNWDFIPWLTAELRRRAGLTPEHDVR